LLGRSRDELAVLRNEDYYITCSQMRTGTGYVFGDNVIVYQRTYRLKDGVDRKNITREFQILSKTKKFDCGAGFQIDIIHDFPVWFDRRDFVDDAGVYLGDCLAELAGIKIIPVQPKFDLVQAVGMRHWTNYHLTFGIWQLNFIFFADCILN